MPHLDNEEDVHPVRIWESHIWGSFSEETSASMYWIDENGKTETETITEVSNSSIAGSGNARARILICKGTVWNDHQITMEDMERWMNIVEFPHDPLRRFMYLDTLGIEHEIERDENGKVIAVSVLLRFEVTEQRAFISFFRHDFETDQHDIAIFMGELWHDQLVERLPKIAKMVGKAPYFVMVPLIQQAAQRMNNMRQTANTNLNEVEVTLGASNNIAHLRSIGLKPTSMPLGDMNKALVSVQIDISDVIEEGTAMNQQLQELIDLFEEAYRDPPATIPASCPNPIKVLKAEYLSLIRHINIIKTVNGSAQRRLESLFAVLLNRISRSDAQLSYQIAKAAKSDSTAMKTISILTLIYLPATFVSAIFSTTFFNFQNWNFGDPDTDHYVVSRGWYVFLCCCLGLTAVTVGIWRWWNLREEKKTLTVLASIDDSHHLAEDDEDAADNTKSNEKEAPDETRSEDSSSDNEIDLGFEQPRGAVVETTGGASRGPSVELQDEKRIKFLGQHPRVNTLRENEDTHSGGLQDGIQALDGRRSYSFKKRSKTDETFRELIDDGTGVGAGGGGGGGTDLEMGGSRGERHWNRSRQVLIGNGIARLVRRSQQSDSRTGSGARSGERVGTGVVGRRGSRRTDSIPE